jgi:hypothetical protein
MNVRSYTIAVAVALSLVFAAASVGGSTRPSLTLHALKPAVSVAGQHFRAREYVRTTLTFNSVTRSRLVRASRLGAFSVELGPLPESFDPCNDTFRVVARGRTGDEATVKFVARQCAPRD